MKCAKPFKKNGIEFGCGQCMPCRIDRSRLWTSRILLESRLHDHNCFVTLTYDDAHLPPGGTLNKRHCQLFLKRLRKKYPAKGVRFFAVGEYGDTSQRPHYHLCLFGVSLFDEHLVQNAWRDRKGAPIGFVKVDELNAGTAGYVSQYVCKKWTNGNDLHTQEKLRGRAPEFATMSLRPGIGAPAARVIARAIENRELDIPSTLRVDGTIRPLGRYVKRKIRELFPNASQIEKYEREVWLLEVHEEKMREMQEAEAAGKTYEQYRFEKRRQTFLNTVARHKAFKQKRSI